MLKTLKLTFLGPRIYETLQDYNKKGNRLEKFKLEIKLWNPENYPCRLCKRFLTQFHFIQHIL